MGQSGLEPPTSRLSVVCSNQLSYWPIGGDERNRTADPLLARQVLSQLSYTPTFAPFGSVQIVFQTLAFGVPGETQQRGFVGVRTSSEVNEHSLRGCERYEACEDEECAL